MTCWRCHDAFTIRLRGGRSAPCPVCYHRKSDIEKVGVLLLCAPKSVYRNRVTLGGK